MTFNITNKDKILITGSNGMVGSSIIKALKRFKNENGLRDLTLLSPNKLELDLGNESAVLEWFKKHKPNLVINAAAKVGGIMANTNYPFDFLYENLKIQNNVINASYKNGVKRFLFLGSSCIYPKFSKQPIKEEYLLNSSLEPTNQWYALAKIAGIKLCEALKKQYGFESISLMPTNLYGEGDNYHLKNSHVLPALIRKFYEAKINNYDKVFCWGSGKPLREFLYVDDLAEACIFVLNNFQSKNKCEKNLNNEFPSLINVGSNYEISIKKLALLIAEQFKFEGEIIWDTSKPDGTIRKKLDTSKLTDLGWKATTNLKEGIKKTIKCFKKDYQSGKLRGL